MCSMDKNKFVDHWSMYRLDTPKQVSGGRLVHQFVQLVTRFQAMSHAPMSWYQRGSPRTWRDWGASTGRG
jgi:predicted metalloprotease with PDZ domain